MSLLGSVLQLAAHARGHVLDRRSDHPQHIQERTLARLLRTAARTAFAREHGLARVRDVNRFRQRVPLRTYAQLEPWFARALAGEGNVSWPGQIPYFGMSSGTTAGNKYLPISLAAVRQQQRGGFEPIAAFLRNGGQPDVLGGAAILLGGSTQLERRVSGAYVGDNTGIMARHVPRWLRDKQLPSEAVRGIASWDDKLRALAEEAVTRDVRMIAGTPAWFAGLFDAVLAVAERRQLPARSIQDIWPRLRLLTGGGVRYEPYRSLIEARVGKHVPYLDVYNATEGGIMGVQDSLDEAAMLLLPDAGVFYEFIPIEELTAASPRRLALWEVEVDVVYALAVSTLSGLFGYLIGDCLRFVSTFPHRFVFEGRTAAFLNVTGEHVCQAELERAVAAACAEQGAVLAEFTVFSQVSPSSVARHVFLVECEGVPPDPQRLAAAIDRDIARGNEDYRVHRASSLVLAEPQVRLLARGAFERFMRAHDKLGGQHKVPRVIEKPELIAELSGLALPRPAGTESARYQPASPRSS